MRVVGSRLCLQNSSGQQGGGNWVTGELATPPEVRAEVNDSGGGDCSGRCAGSAATT